MSGTTIYGSYNTPITLSNSATQNPATIALGAIIQTSTTTALYGTSGTFWTVAANGAIEGTIGISLAGGGDVSDGAGSNILGSSYGIVLGNGGSVSTAAGGYVRGGQEGIDIRGSTGTVENSGVIRGMSTSTSIGVYLRAGGSITNTRSASISGANYGGEIAGGAGTVINSGTITASNSAFSSATGIGVDLKAGGLVTNAASASISGAVGVLVDAAGTVANSGSISSTRPDGFGVDIAGAGTVVNSGLISVGTTNRGTAVILGQGGYVSNASGASIVGGLGVGVVVAGVGTVVNGGAISGAEAVNIDHGGTVINAASGSISGISRGVLIVDGAGTVFNAGSINASNPRNGGYPDGVYLGRGSVTNAASGSIVGDSHGVHLGDGGAGTVLNFGSISSTRSVSSGVYLKVDGTVTNFASASIAGVQVGVSAVAGATVANAGAISGKTGVQLQSGYVTNAASGSITGGIGFTETGTVINSGVISGSDGIEIGGAGMIANTGVIGGATGIEINGDATIVNSAVINGTTGAAVYFKGGGTLTNALRGSISGYQYGVRAGASTDAVYNSGSIVNTATSGAGVYLRAGGYLANAASASIAGGQYGVEVAGQSGFVVNDGSIGNGNTSGAAIALKANGTVLNSASASITGAGYGVEILGRGSVVLNSGTIAGAAFAGIELGAGGHVSNNADALIEGGTVGIRLGAGGAVENGGTITGFGGKAIAAYGTVASRVVMDAGAVFNGNVVASASASNTLELASGVSAGKISNVGTSFVNFGSVIIDSGAQWELTGSSTLAAGSTLTNNGTLSISAATLSDAGGIINDGRIELDPSTLTVASLTGTGTVTIDAGSTLSVQGAVSASQDIVFTGSGGELDLGAPSQFSGTITGFADGDIIDLTSVADVAGSHADMNYSTNVLTVTEGSAVYRFQFDKAEQFTGDFLHLISQDGSTLIEENQIACYARGTLIAIDRGEVAVETLAIGDLVVTASGAQRPIKWIGRRSYGGRFILGRKDILPICFKAGSLGDDLPRRDLFVSPHHAMYFDDVLIEARDLINGVSIVQAEQVDQIDYFHIELETHDVILAEGAPSETFVDDDSRSMFHNAHEYAALYPDDAGRSPRYCAPRLDIGYEVEAVRQRLAIRAGFAVGPAAIGALRGFVDAVSERHIEGWAQHVHDPEAPVCLDIFVSGRLIGRVLANSDRADLRDAGIGSGRHGFHFVPPSGISLEDIEIRCSLDGAPLPWSAEARHRPRSRAA